MPETSKLMTLAEAAALLRMSSDRLSRLAARGVVPVLRCGPRGRLLFDREQLVEAITTAGRLAGVPTVDARA